MLVGVLQPLTMLVVHALIGWSPLHRFLCRIVASHNFHVEAPCIRGLLTPYTGGIENTRVSPFRKLPQTPRPQYSEKAGVVLFQSRTGMFIHRDLYEELQRIQILLLTDRLKSPNYFQNVLRNFLKSHFLYSISV